MRSAKTLIRLRGCAVWSESSLVAQVLRFRCALAHFKINVGKSNFWHVHPALSQISQVPSADTNGQRQGLVKLYWCTRISYHCLYKTLSAFSHVVDQLFVGKKNKKKKKKKNISCVFRTFKRVKGNGYTYRGGNCQIWLHPLLKRGLL